jgi:ATP/maltotriose-dependent transcriptional regulator MalT
MPAVEHFVGRHEELERLWINLQPGKPERRKVVVLNGLAGVGKTQLASRFARDHKDKFTAILWLNGKGRETLLQSLASVFPRLPGQAQKPTSINLEEVKQMLDR